jgi:hypothetical protein
VEDKASDEVVVKWGKDKISDIPKVCVSRWTHQVKHVEIGDGAGRVGMSVGWMV